MSLIESALSAIDAIEPSLRQRLVPASPEDVTRLEREAALDVPDEYRDFFAAMGGNADVIFGDMVRISIAGALQFYRAHHLSARPLTSPRFLYLGTLEVGAPEEHRIFVKAPSFEAVFDDDGQLQPYPAGTIVRAQGNPEQDHRAYFTDLAEFLVFHTWRRWRLQRRAHVAQFDLEDVGEESLKTFTAMCAAWKVVDMGFNRHSLCLEGPAYTVALQRRAEGTELPATVNVGADDRTRLVELLEVAADNLKTSGRRVGSLFCL